MFLEPKKIKFRKRHKGKLGNLEFKNNKVNFGDVGLKSSESGTITARQIESARRAISRKMKKKGKIWVRIFPDLPITSKPNESRMGKGKGNVSHWAIKVKGGTTLFEITGIPRNNALEALRSGSHKLPLKTIAFD